MGILMAGIDITDMFYIVCDRIHAPALCLLLACLIDGIEDLLAELLKLFLRVRTEVEADLCHRNDGMGQPRSSLPAWWSPQM